MFKICSLYLLLFLVAYSIHAESVRNNLKSWRNVTHFSIANKHGKNNVKAVMKTGNMQPDTIEFHLQQRSTLHADHIKTSKTNCLFDGFVIKHSKIDINSPVRLKYCADDADNILELSGLFFFNQKMFTLYLNEDGSIILFNDDDIRNDTLKTHNCAAIEKQSLHTYKENMFKDRENKMINKRTTERSKRQTSYRQQERSFVEILIVVSFEYYQQYGYSQQKVIDNAVELVHFADFYYAVIPNISLHLSLVDVIVFTDPADDPTDGIDDISEVLDTFITLQYSTYDEWPAHDNAILLITRNFTNDSSVVGLAYLATLCDISHSASWVKDDGDTMAVIAGTLAHELGHNFGLYHNPVDSLDPCACNKTACVMDAFGSAGVPPEVFTSCQQSSISNFLETGAAMCLHNEPTKTLDAPYCGDYIVNQVSEECDCGSNDTCEDPCCHPENCTFVLGATCSAMDLCCEPTTCALKASGVVCRDAVNTCDIEEQCDGVNGQCPSDLYHPTGDNCTENGVEGHCYLGNCRSHISQCLEIFEPAGMFTNFINNCWPVNTVGDEWGNCGSVLLQNYTPCSTENES